MGFETSMFGVELRKSAERRRRRLLMSRYRRL